MNRTIAVAILFCAISLFAIHAASAITIPTVSVGNAGNAGEVQSQGTFGGVAYGYRMGTTEVTVGQYTAFLNAVAATDTYALYNTSMATDLNIAGISRSGASGSYSYSAIGSADHPVTYVNWGAAARFSNWLHNNQPTGLQIASTTEDGAYPLNGAITSAALNAISRNAGAKWFIPTENEWYKAAYHKNDGATGNYWDYPTSTDAIPYSDQSPGSGAPTQSNTANFFKNDGSANGYNDGYAVTGFGGYNSSQNYLTDAGAYTSATSPYGTFDQGGSVFEWNEALISVPFRGLRGGAWSLDSSYLLSSFRDYINPPSSTNLLIGFRVASIPEPSSFVLAASGLAAGFSGWRRRTKRLAGPGGESDNFPKSSERFGPLSPYP
jgi:formylglycine-generating enzyme required for sulfatase activity